MNEVKLLKTYHSPLYVYDRSILEDRCNQIKAFADILRNALPGIKISMHYSSKANSNPHILSVVEQAGLDVDAMSPAELKFAYRAGFTTDRILYVCNNISLEEMEYVVDRGVLMCLDSTSQVETFGKNFSGRSIMVRINPGTAGVGHSEKVKTSGKATKFGISEENLPWLFEVAEKYNIRIIGTHQHLGSLFLNDKIPDYIDGVKAGLDIVKNHFKDVEIVDLGGGFGVPYKPDEVPLDLPIVAENLIPILKEFIVECPSVAEFKFEPGRYIPCESGIILGTVTAVKYENGIYWIGTDIGMNQLVRPSMYGSYHEIEVVHRHPSIPHPAVTANFCGNICESGDILGKDRLVGLPEVGDIVVVRNAGAYGFSMASNYTGRARPAEVMVDNGSEKVIRNRETFDDMLHNIVW